MQVGLSGAVRDAAGGVEYIEITAESIRELMRKLVERHPKMQQLIDEAGIAVAINGTIFRDTWGEAIPQDAEVFLIPRIPGG